MSAASEIAQAKAGLLEGWQRALAGARADDPAAWRSLFAPDHRWHGPHPLNDCEGVEAWLERVWRPFAGACAGIERRDDILIGGHFRDGLWVCATGHFLGTFERSWLGIPPTGRPLFVRYGEFSRFEGGHIVESYVILDLPGVMRQAGVWPLAPSLGVELLVPGPATRDGVRLAPADEAESRASLALVEAMIAGLMRYDGQRLESMEMTRYWHPGMMWYGPAGIGTARGLRGFEDHHQRPFLVAFPDRVGGNHKARVGEGAYVASTGWPSVYATHLGGGFLGLPPTGRRVGMRVMDFWRREDTLLRENWVFIDLIDLLLQMGVDVFERLAVQLGAGAGSPATR